MKLETINGSLVAAYLAGHLNARIRMAVDDGDLETAISHLKALTRAFTNLEFNQACHEWLRDWNKQLEHYENLRIKRTAR